MTKRVLIVLLTAANLLLLTMLVLGSYSLPAARAQQGGGTGDYLAATAGAMGQSYEVLYLLEGRSRRLFAFYPRDVQSRRLDFGGFRDLAEDLRTKK